MNSSKKNRSRRKVILTRKLSSTICNRSQTPAGNYRRRINSLLKNNKELALTLEDVRHDLSYKKNLLDEYSGYFNKIMCARLKILQLHSNIKSFMQDLDEVVLMLKIENTNLVPFGAPTRSCRNWKNNMSKLEESAREDNPVDSTSCNKKIVENTVDHFLDQVISDVNNVSNIDFASKKRFKGISDETIKRSDCSNDKIISVTPSTSKKALDDYPKNSVNSTGVNKSHNDNEKLLANLENNSSCQVLNTNEVQVPRVSHCNEVNDAMEMDASGVVVPNNVSPFKNEGCETPKLETPLKLTMPVEAPPELNSNIADSTSTSAENFTKISTNPSVDSLPLQKIISSKIPRIVFLDKSKMKNKYSEITSKEKKVEKRKLFKVTDESDGNGSRRKTFVVKNANYSKPSTILDQAEPNLLLDKSVTNNVTIESCKAIVSRKTFVIKPSDTEDIHVSPFDRRKTFVKNSNIGKKSEKSIAVENFKVQTDSEIPNVGKKPEKSIPVENSKLQMDTEISNVDKKSEKSNAVENSKLQTNKKISSDVNIQKDDNVVELIQDNINFSLDRKSDVIKNDEICEIQEINDKESDIKVLNIASNDFYETENLNISCNKRKSRFPKHVSYKLFLESSESECESIPDADLCLIKEISPISTPPIRRQISKTKPKKVFVFNADKQSSNSDKKSIGFRQKNSENFSKQKVDICQSGEIASLDVNTNLSDTVGNGITDAIQQKCLGVKTIKSAGKSKKRVKEKLRTKDTDKNTVIVHAEIHPPPSSLKMAETDTLDAENKDILQLEKFQVSVVLNDLFETENTDILNTCTKSEFLKKNNSFILKSPLSENSRNIKPVEECNIKATCITNNSEDLLSKRGRRRKVVSYAEPPLNRKVRR